SANKLKDVDGRDTPGTKCPRASLPEQLVRRGDQAEGRIGAAVRAELLGVGEIFFRIDDRRIAVLLVIGVEPGEQNVDRVRVEVEEGLAVDRREIPLLGVGGRGEGEDSGNEGDAAEHRQTLSMCGGTSDFRHLTSDICPLKTQTPAEAGVWNNFL